MRLTKTLKIFFLILGMYSSVSSLFAQQQDSNATAGDVSEESTLYEIKLSRLQRLISNDIKNSISLQYAADVLSLIEDAKGFADQGDYSIADEFLESALELVRDKPEKNTEEKVDATAKTEWSYQGLFGSELWQQKFGIVLSDQDSVIYESQGNPFVGFRVLMDYQNDVKTQTQMQLEARLSSEYNSGKLTFQNNHQLNSHIRTSVENLFDITKYKRDAELSYFDDNLNAGVFFTLAKSLGFELRNEMQFLRYSNESEYFHSFLQNYARGKVSFLLANLGRIEFQYGARIRTHDQAESRDYSERIIGGDFWSISGGRKSLYVNIQQNVRTYRYGFVDSLFSNNFNNIYGELAFRYSLDRHLAFRFKTKGEKRTYQAFSYATPNYLDLVAEPSFDFNFGLPWTVRLGYQFRNRKHTFSSHVTDENPEIEDYYSHGPVISVDVFSTGGFIASLSNSFELRRYPNAPYSDGSGLSLYSNRNINSLFFFMTWNLSSHWDLNAMANFDYDQDKNIEGADSRTNLLNFELSYKF